MNSPSPLQSLRRHTPQFRYIAFAISSFSFLFLAVMIYVGDQRMPNPEYFSVFYVGVVLATVQIPLSIYMWRYIPPRIPPPRDEKILISRFRMTMLVGFLLCLGVVKYAGIGAVLTGYAYQFSFLGGLALGTMIYHLPGERTYELFLRGISGK